MKAMEENASQLLLMEAALLITATRVRIARSVRLLDKGLDAGRALTGGAASISRRQSSTHPPSAPPF